MLKKSKIIFIVGIIILSIWLGYIFMNKKITYENTVNVNKFYNTTKEYKYFGLLKIPKIKLENVIYLKRDSKNNVNKNIYVVSDKMNFIVLAAHSGDSEIAYFKDLNKLNIRDTLEFINKEQKRTYELFYIMQIMKTGTAKLKKYDYPVMILITCSKTEKNKQEVYYFRLKNSQKSV